MCGLVGVAGVLTQKDKDAFRTLLVLDTLRGPHSTGVAAVDKDGEWGLAKKKGNSWDLFDSREYNSVMSQLSYVLIGHNRYATKGRINNINAHPFEFQHVVGAHNGTIRKQQNLIDHKEFEVDSENIYHSINEIGLEDTLAVLDGAYALTYWDKRTEDLVLLRNSERPLCYTFSEDGKTLYWASEEWMLNVALSRCGLKHGEVIDVRPCNIYRFKIDRKYQPDPIVTHIQGFKEYKAPPPPVVKHQTSLHGNYRGGYLPGKQNPPSGVSSTGQNQPLHKGPVFSQLVGSVAEFTIEGHQQNHYKQWYIKGLLKEFPEVEVRVYAAPDSALWNSMTANYDSLWEGTITSFSKVGDMGYINMRLSSVAQVIDEDYDGDDDTAVGYNNKLLTEEQFKHNTRNGCAWCSVKVEMKDAPDLYWVADDSFVCSDCQQVEEVQEYIGQAI